MTGIGLDQNIVGFAGHCAGGNGDFFMRPTNRAGDFPVNPDQAFPARDQAQDNALSGCRLGQGNRTFEPAVFPFGAPGGALGHGAKCLRHRLFGGKLFCCGKTTQRNAV